MSTFRSSRQMISKIEKTEINKNLSSERPPAIAANRRQQYRSR